MKREAYGCSKMMLLCECLGIDMWQAVGILESIWTLASIEAPQGNIGKLSNRTIGLWLRYRGDIDALIDALVKSGWLERSEQYRLLIHDWHEHSTDTVKRRLSRNHLPFLSGSKHVAGNVCQSSSLQVTGHFQTNGHGGLPLPLPTPLPSPLLESSMEEHGIPSWEEFLGKLSIHRGKPAENTRQAHDFWEKLDYEQKLERYNSVTRRIDVGNEFYRDCTTYNYLARHWDQHTQMSPEILRTIGPHYQDFPERRATK